MDNYFIEIPNEKTKTYRLITLLMLIMNGLIFGFVFINITASFDRKVSLLGIILNIISVAVFVTFNYSKINRLKNYSVEIGFIISALLWLLIGKYLLAIFLLAFAVFGYFTNKKFIISISKEGIKYPSFPVTLFLWQDVVNVILKDDILTIDLKDNHLFQFTLPKSNTASIDENEFNVFCKSQLEAGAQ
jgi:hypothetical protein